MLIDMTDDEFVLIQELADQVLNVPLGSNMRRVVTNQLQPILHKHGFTNFRQLCDYFQKGASQADIAAVLNIITPDHTFFFRERDHFDFFLRKFLPEQLRKDKNHDFRIWCAACSTGEEPYTLAMLLADFFHNYPAWETGILATDISRISLEKALRGVYNNDRTAGVPPHYKSAFLQPGPGGEWQVTEKLRRLITFRCLNLMTPQYPFRQPFDAIFCRNVLIYFDENAIRQVIGHFYDFTQPGGYLFIGASESLQTLNTPWKYVAPGIYQKEEAA